MRVRYTVTALAEIQDICGYIARKNPKAASSVAAAIERTVTWITKHPLTPPVVHGGEVRAKLVEKYQYRIFYVLAGSELIVRNVRHTRRRKPWEVEV
jgi:toxin ParE1/3/4